LLKRYAKQLFKVQNVSAVLHLSSIVSLMTSRRTDVLKCSKIISSADTPILAKTYDLHPAAVAGIFA